MPSLITRLTARALQRSKALHARIAVATTTALLGGGAAQASAAPTGASGTTGTTAGGFAFNVTPNVGGAPGASGLQAAIDVAAAYALFACTAGFVLGAAIWAIGGRIGNDFTATGGKTGMLTALACAALIGAASALLGWSYHLG